MAAKKQGGVAGKVIGGALIAGALGVAAGMLFAPKAGKELRKDIKNDVKHKYADFYKFAAVKFKAVKHLSEKDYHEFMTKTVHAYAKAKKISAAEAKDLMSHGRELWKTLKKHF